LNEIFDPARNSSIVAQLKLKSGGDFKAGNKIKPIGIHRSLEQPLPYIAIHVELGCKVLYRASGGTLMVTTSEPPFPGQFRLLTSDWIIARNELETMQNAHVGKEEMSTQREFIAEKRAAMDYCNRFSIYVRGASSQTYGILKKANIEKEFTTLLNTARASIDDEYRAQNMRPCERLENTSAHMAWMAEYIAEDPENSDEGDSGSEDDDIR
jgi:hypothetical protein